MRSHSTETAKRKNDHPICTEGSAAGALAEAGEWYAESSENRIAAENRRKEYTREMNTATIRMQGLACSRDKRRIGVGDRLQRADHPEEAVNSLEHEPDEFGASTVSAVGHDSEAGTEQPGRSQVSAGI